VEGEIFPIRTSTNRNRIKTLSWLSASELRMLAEALVAADFKRRQVILREAELASEAHILLSRYFLSDRSFLRGPRHRNCYCSVQPGSGAIAQPRLSRIF
jgi:hypothetical protein